jgi:hypothetical protein
LRHCRPGTPIVHEYGGEAGVRLITRVSAPHPKGVGSALAVAEKKTAGGKRVYELITDEVVVGKLVEIDHCGTRMPEGQR